MKAINVNVGIIGHIDSGKTSLCRALSTITSTASLDKNPQSQERGITLDLGFSSFSTEAPPHFQDKGYDTIQFCLVDCPGHASLIRTIIGGAQIIDMCCLVIDAIKGIQTQTAECLVLAQILAQKMVVIVNKADMIPEQDREKKLKAITTKLRKVFAKTKFGEQVPMVTVSANPQDGSEPFGLDKMLDALKAVPFPERSSDGPFYFAFDHCFAIKGQGTVLTGTILSGSVKPNQPVELPGTGITRKVRSLQQFKKSVDFARQGDRVAICVPALDQNLERGIITDGKVAVPTMDACIAVVRKISYFKGSVTTKSKFHITVGHSTVMGQLQFFRPFGDAQKPAEVNDQGLGGSLCVGAFLSEQQGKWPTVFDMKQVYLHADELLDESDPDCGEVVYCLIRFEKPITCPSGSLLIGSKFDFDIHSPNCRIGFFGKIIQPIKPCQYGCVNDKKPEQELPMLKIVKQKQKVGTMERIDKNDPYLVIGKDLFKKETDMSLFINLKVVHPSSKNEGVIDSSFGKSGKYKVRFQEEVKVEQDAKGNVQGREEIVLQYHKYLFDSSKRITQV